MDTIQIAVKREPVKVDADGENSQNGHIINNEGSPLQLEHLKKESAAVVASSFTPSRVTAHILFSEMKRLFHSINLSIR